MRTLSQKHISIVIVVVALLSIALTFYLWACLYKQHWLVILVMIRGITFGDTGGYLRRIAGRWYEAMDGLAFPRGGTLYFIDTIQVLISLPISLLLVQPRHLIASCLEK